MCRFWPKVKQEKGKTNKERVIKANGRFYHILVYCYILKTPMFGVFATWTRSCWVPPRECFNSTSESLSKLFPN